MNQRSLLSRWFSIETGEGRALALLIAHSFLIGLARWVMESASDAIYLGQQDIHTLPLVFIGIGVVSTILGLAYGRAEGFLSFRGLLSVTLCFLALSVAALWALLVFTSFSWVPVLIQIWNDTIEVFTTVELGALAGWMFNVRQAKRLYAIIGAGDVVAGILGGFIIPPLVNVTGTPALLLLVAVALAAAMVLMQYILRTIEQQGEAEESEPAASRSEPKPVPLLKRLRDPYLALLLALAAIDTIVFFFSVTAFLADSRARFPDEDQLAQFFGFVFSGVSFVTLIMRTVVSARLVRRFGLIGGLMLLPLALLVASSLGMAAGLLVPGTLLAFWSIIVIRLTYAVLFDSTFQPTALMLFQPISRHTRVWAQGFVETVGKPIVTGLAGLLLLGFMAVAPLEGRYVAWVLVVACLAWTIVSARAARGYTQVLIQALEQRSLRGFHLSLTDATTVALLERGLDDPHPAAVIYCLNQMEQVGSDRLAPALLRLLRHDAAEVRVDALHKLERLLFREALPDVLRLAAEDPAPRVRAAALRAAVALGETDVFDIVLPFLDEANDEVKSGAAVGLLVHGGIEGVLAAGESLIRMLDSASAAERAQAARILGQVGIRNFYRPLRKLLDDVSPEVRRAALAAAPSVRNPALWPSVVANLARPDSRHAAVNALVAIGEPAIDEIAKAFEDPDVDRRTRLRIVRVIARIHGPKSLEFLRSRATYPDSEIRGLVLVALAARKYQASETEQPAILEALQQEMAATAWLAAARADIESADGAYRDLMAELELALAHEEPRLRDMLFHLLSALYPAEAILGARHNLDSPDEETRAYAIEVLDNLLPVGLRAQLLPLVEDMTPAERLSRLSADLAQELLGVEARVGDVALRPLAWISHWTKACAIDATARIDARELLSPVLAELDSPDPLIRETSLWAAGWMGSGEVVDQVRPLVDDPVKQVADMAAHVVGQFENVVDIDALFAAAAAGED